MLLRRQFSCPERSLYLAGLVQTGSQDEKVAVWILDAVQCLLQSLDQTARIFRRMNRLLHSEVRILQCPDLPSTS